MKVPRAADASGSPRWVLVIGDLVLDLVALLPVALDALHRGADTPGRLAPALGGSAANTAVWLARLGQRVRFVSRVGTDPLGSALVEDLRREGVEPWVVRDATLPTGSILVLVEPGGERSMVIAPGAHHMLTPEDVPACLLDAAALVHLTGYSLYRETSRSAVQHTLEAARRRGVPVSVDASSASLLQAFGPRDFVEAISGARYLLANLDEGRLLTGWEAPEDVVRTLAARFPVVALKLGADGCLCAAGDERVRLPVAHAGSVVDTTGAGDAWDAGFLAGQLLGLGLHESAALGNRLAAWVVQRPAAVPAGWGEQDLEIVLGGF